MRTSQPPGGSGKRQARVAALSEVALVCERAKSVVDLAEPLVIAARRALGARTFALAIVDDAAEPIVAVSGADQYGLGIWTTQALVRLSRADGGAAELARRLGEDAPSAVMAAPVLIAGRLRAVIAGRGFRAREPADRAELVLASVAHSLALAVRALEAEASASRAQQIATVLAAAVAGMDVEQLVAPLAAALSPHLAFSHLRLVLTPTEGTRAEYTAVSNGSAGASESVPPPSGERPRSLELLLEHAGRSVGKLVVLASPGQRLDARDTALLEHLAPHLATIAASAPEQGVARDSERVREQLMHSERLASVGQLAAGVAHEVNNPLNVILSNLQLLHDRARQGDLDLGAGAGTEEALSESIEGVRRIATAVDHLRDYARGERSESADLDLNDVVRTAVNIVEGQIRYSARLELELSSLPLVRGDHGRLVQLVTNLLMNAAQSFDEDQQARNRIRIRTREEAGTVRLTIRDNGSGIPSSQQQRVFEPFFTTKAESSATGLGLSVCADIVRRHGGRITMKSREGVGSRFDVVFPAVASATPTHSPSEVRAQFRARILLVDDDAAVLRALGRVLSQKNDVVAVDGGAAAIELLRRDRHFDVVVCDVMMPDVDGAAVYDAMVDIAPELRRRTIFCTGGEFTARAKTFLAGTDNTVLFKPVDNEALVAAVAEVLARTQSMLPSTGNSG